MYNKNSNNLNYTDEDDSKPSKSKEIGKSLVGTTAKVGVKSTKAVMKITTKVAWETSKFAIKKVGSTANKSAKRTLKSFILANLTVVIPVLVILFILIIGVTSIASSMLVVYAKDKIDNAKEVVADTTNDMVNTYSQYLLEVNKQETIEYGSPEDSTGNGASGGGISGVFGGTSGTAQQLEGKALITQLYNSMAEVQNKYGIEGFDMEFIYGAAITETCCSPIKWSYYVPIGNDYNASGNFDIKNYGVKEVMEARKSGQLDEAIFNRIYNDGDTYITAWQMDYKIFGGSGGKPGGWSADTWIQNFSSATYDPLNMPKTLDALGNYVKNSRQPTITKIQLKSNNDKADMMRMVYAIRHVGTTNKTKSRTDGCAFSAYETNTEWRSTWCYPYIEGLNPHIDLMRAALNEYKSNGPIFQEYYAMMHGQTKTNSNGPKSLTVIEKLYAQQGWEKVGNERWRKKFGDGDGYVTVAGQDVGYPIRVFWGAKIGFPEFTKLAQNS